MSDKPSPETEEKLAIFAEQTARVTRGGEAAAWSDVEKADLLKSFKSVSQSVAEMLIEGEVPESAFKMNKIEVKLGISAKGKVGFLGTGAEAGADASITVTFERAPKP